MTDRGAASSDSAFEVTRYVSNTAWMLAEKVLTLGLGLLAIVLLARSLGPEDFGVFNYALSIVALASVASHLGLAGIVVKELKERPNQQREILNTVLTLKLVAAAIAFGSIVIISFFTAKSSETFWTITIIGLILISQPTEVFNMWFQSKVQAKFGALAHAVGGLFGNLLKIFVALMGFTVLYAAAAHFLQMFLVATILYFFFLRKKSWPEGFAFSLNGSGALIRQGAWVFLGSISAVVYLKVDQVMIAAFLNVESVGQYAAAAKISEAWYFIPGIIMASVFPKLIEKRKEAPEAYYYFIEKLLRLLFLMAVFLVLGALLFSDIVINILYGDEYTNSIGVLQIHIVASFFVFMRALVSKWIIVEELFVFSFVSQGLGALVNVVLNILFIPRFGIEGAAWATVISYSIAGYISLAVHGRSRRLFLIMTKVMVYGWTLSIKDLIAGKRFYS